MLSTLIFLQATLTLPANTAYLVGASEGRLNDQGELAGWAGAPASLMWGGFTTVSGRADARLLIAGADPKATFRLQVRGPSGSVYRTTGAELRFSQVDLSTPGWYTFTVLATGTNFGVVKGLELSGPAVQSAKFNLKERRNAASVHIGYPGANDKQVEWFYNEVRAQEEPIHTFYMACGFRRGYFGMQINGPKERRIIFSIWDSGKEAVDRSKVGNDDRVRLLAKGSGVVASDFGNEGTGGHSHLVHPWRTDQVQRFLVHAQKDGTGTIYTGYYFMPENNKWTLVASFRAPKDGQLLRGAHSFIENFWGDNGNLLRAAIFGPTWIKATGEPWTQMSSARFTHDATGGKDRYDYDLKPVRNGFRLQNGGFEGASPKLGTIMTTRSTASPPAIDLDHLPTG